MPANQILFTSAHAAPAVAEAIIRTVRHPLVVLSANLRVNTANEAFYRTFGLQPQETEGRPLLELSGGAWASQRGRIRSCGRTREADGAARTKAPGPMPRRDPHPPAGAGRRAPRGPKERGGLRALCIRE